MIPFKEVTHAETGVKQRIPWDWHRAQAKLQEFKRKHTARLNAVDIERAHAAGVNVPEGETVLRTFVDDGTGNMVVDPIASKIKHGGADLNDAMIPEWQAFCSVPQNDDGVEYPMPTYKSKQATKLNSPITERELPPQRRGPGRPRKDGMQSL